MIKGADESLQSAESSILRCYLDLAKSPLTGDYLTMIRRPIEDSVRRAMADTPVVLLNGARQTGKTTLA